WPLFLFSLPLPPVAAPLVYVSPLYFLPSSLLPPPLSHSLTASPQATASSPACCTSLRVFHPPIPPPTPKTSPPTVRRSQSRPAAPCRNDGGCCRRRACHPSSLHAARLTRDAMHASPYFSAARCRYIASHHVLPLELARMSLSFSPSLKLPDVPLLSFDATASR
ncbi:hypothetical protein FB451DRAFT_1479564, partial [Mycena latifolia]